MVPIILSHFFAYSLLLASVATVHIMGSILFDAFYCMLFEILSLKYMHALDASFWLLLSMFFWFFHGPYFSFFALQVKMEFTLP